MIDILKLHAFIWQLLNLSESLIAVFHTGNYCLTKIEFNKVGSMHFQI